MILANLRRAISRRRGQSLVEMAMVLPVLAFLTFGLLDFGRAYYYQVAVTNAAREGARTAILNIYIGPLTPSCSSSNGYATCPVETDDAIRQAVHNELSGTQIVVPDSAITICPPHDSTMSTAGCPNTNNRVDLWNAGQYSAYYVNVNVKYNFQLYTPILQNLLGNPITMSVSVQMRPNY
jgi:Flp pilus assembly protein TadG